MKELILFTLLIIGCDTIEPKDCAGVVGGNAVKDACGECGGDGSTCEQVDGMWTIFYKTLTPIGGFQFKVVGATVVDVSGGAETVGFSVSTGNNTVLGFSLQGASIPAGEGVLVVLELTGDGETCLEDVIISDSSGNALGYTVEGCNTISINEESQVIDDT